MDDGNAFIQVSSKNHRDGEIRGLVSYYCQLCCYGIKELHITELPFCSMVLCLMTFVIVSQVVLPNTCYSTSATGSRLPIDRPTLIDDDASHGGSVESLPNSCFFEKRFRTSGSTWSPEYDPTCATCTCKVSNNCR